MCKNFFVFISTFLVFHSCNQNTENNIDNSPYVQLSKDERINKRWNDRIDSVSYAIGLDVATRLNQQFDKFNHKKINKAIDDYFTGEKFELTDKERISVINMYNNLLAPKFKMDLEKKNMEEGKIFLKSNKNKPGVIEHKSGIQYKIVNKKDGVMPQSNDIVSIHYIGKLIDGTKFDSSYDRGKPSTVPLNRLIPGWSQGIQLMTVGSTFQIFIPGHLAYGQNEGPGGPAATLIFQVELLEIIREANAKD